jgi:hypothetical protein
VEPLVIALGLVGLASPEEARFLERLAVRAYERGDFARALALYGEVQVAAPTDANRFNMALAAQGVGEKELAFALFESFLSDATGTGPIIGFARQQRDALARELALVRVTSDPPGATIEVARTEGIGFGRTPTVVPFRPGRTEIVLHRLGFETARGEVTAVRGRQVDLHLELVRQTGRLRIAPDPLEAEIEVWVDGEGPPLAIQPGVDTPVPAGAHRIRIRSEGFEPLEQSVVVESGQVVVRRPRLLPVPPAIGTILVSAGYRQVQVWVDGQRRADTPVALRETAGLHRIELRDADGQRLWQDDVLVLGDAQVLRWVRLDD